MTDPALPPAAPPPVPPNEVPKLRVLEAIWPATGIVLFLGVVIGGYLGWHDAVQADRGSNYNVGSAVGGALAAGLIPLLLGGIVHLFNRRARLPINLTILLLVALILLGSGSKALMQNRIATRNNQVVLLEMSEKLEGYKVRMRAAMESGDVSASSQLDAETLQLFKEYRSKVKGPLGEYLDRFIAFREELAAAASEYGKASAPINLETIFDVTDNQSVTEIEERIALIRSWREANEALTAPYRELDALTRDTSMLKAEYEREFARGMTVGLARTVGPVLEIRKAEETMSGLTLEAFESLRAEWGKVTPGEVLEEWRFEDPAAERRKSEIVEEIVAAVDRQLEAQDRLFR
jgi:hypothetical protein